MFNIAKELTLKDLKGEYELPVNNDMKRWAGRAVRVVDVGKNIESSRKVYRIDKDKGKNKWSEDMFLNA